jgi:hypothetical protein
MDLGVNAEPAPTPTIPLARGSRAQRFEEFRAWGLGFMGP